MRTRELFQMRWSTGGVLPTAAVSAGVHIRTFEPGRDEDEFLAVNARAFAWHPEQSRLDRASLREKMSQDWFDPAGFFLAVDDGGALLGFHWTKVHPTDPTPRADESGGSGPVGEIYVLGVDPRAAVRGLGGVLTRVGLQYLSGRPGLKTVMLYVEGDNDRALALYRRFGFAVSGTDVVYRRPKPDSAQTRAVTPPADSSPFVAVRAPSDRSLGHTTGVFRSGRASFTRRSRGAGRPSTWPA